VFFGDGDAHTSSFIEMSFFYHARSDLASTRLDIAPFHWTASDATLRRCKRQRGCNMMSRSEHTIWSQVKHRPHVVPPALASIKPRTTPPPQGSEVPALPSHCELV
jgi:hypothetical protein